MKRLVVMILMSLMVFTLTGCDSEKTVNEGPIYDVYMLAVSVSATDLTYEEWLDSIQGPQGNDGREVELQVTDGQCH